MAAEYSANLLQTVAPNQSVVFSESPVPCNRGLVFHRDESGLFRVASRAECIAVCCCNLPETLYQVAFHANVQIPEGGTVEEISLAIAIDGEIDPSSTMIVNPTAVELLENVGAEIIVAVPCICRCSTVPVRNTSAQDIDVQNANIIFSYLGVRR